MKILAIDTSTSIFSLCLKIDDHEEIIEYEAGVTHSKIILQEIKSILKICGLAVSDLDAIAFSSGPGSFTGIRIASGVAYGLAFPHKIPIVPRLQFTVLAEGEIDTSEVEIIAGRCNDRHLFTRLIGCEERVVALCLFRPRKQFAIVGDVGATESLVAAPCDSDIDVFEQSNELFVVVRTLQVNRKSTRLNSSHA